MTDQEAILTLYNINDSLSLLLDHDLGTGDPITQQQILALLRLIREPMQNAIQRLAEKD